MSFARTKFNSHQGGLAAVEFVVILPILLLLMLASAELGRAFYQYNTLTKTVRDGARYLADNSLIGTTGLIDITGEASNTQNLVA
ncbi:MAG: pilus assembly protein, partial [Gammaproteobacteria bacterium]